MQTLELSLRARGPAGDPLPTLFPQLNLYGAKIRRSQLTLIAAASGVGKSSFVTYMVMNMRDKDGPIPSLYFSADSDVGTFGIRAATMANPRASVMDTEKALFGGSSEVYRTLRDKTSHIWVTFQPAPSPSDILEELEAYVLVNGEAPAVIVIDNLMDIPYGDMSERNGQDAVLDFLKQVAVDYGCAVIVLCHVVGEYANGKTPIPLSGLINKIDKRPRLVLTLYEVDPITLGVSIVKNNNGRRDASGNLVVNIPFVKETMWFGTG